MIPPSVYARAPTALRSVEEHEITFSSGGVTLAGSLLLPSTGESLAAVVFLHGSGGEGRWASRYLAGQLATHGIAALIFDKRGVGGSTGDWRQATPDDLAADAARSPHVAFVIGSAAAGIPTDSTELFSVLNSVYPAARSAQDSADASAYVSELVAVAYHVRARTRLDSLATLLRDRPWFFPPPPSDNSYWSFSKVFAQYQPLAWWARVRVPVLLMYGAADQRVPAAESARRIVAALRNAGNADVTVRIYSGCGSHLPTTARSERLACLGARLRARSARLADQTPMTIVRPCEAPS